MNDTTTTLRQRKIYTLLINPRNPRHPLTQAEVAHLLELKRERVSEACKALEEKGFIRRLGDGYNNITYRRGPKDPIIEAQIAASYLEDGEWFDCYGLAFRPPQLAGPSGTENYCSVWRTYLNGGWIQFTVLTEGDLHHIDWHDVKRELREYETWLQNHVWMSHYFSREEAALVLRVPSDYLDETEVHRARGPLLTQC